MRANGVSQGARQQALGDKDVERAPYCAWQAQEGGLFNAVNVRDMVRDGQAEPHPKQEKVVQTLFSPKEDEGGDAGGHRDEREQVHEQVACHRLPHAFVQGDRGDGIGQQRPVIHCIQIYE